MMECAQAKATESTPTAQVMSPALHLIGTASSAEHSRFHFSFIAVCSFFAVNVRILIPNLSAILRNP
jgi:hypothetical protein